MKLSLILLLVIFAFLAKSQETFLEVLPDDRFSEFKSRLTDAQLDEMEFWNSLGNFTLLVPTDDAFDALGDTEDIDWSSVFRYHILISTQTYQQLLDSASGGLMLETLANASITFNSYNNSLVTANGAIVGESGRDIPLGNGIAHSVSMVLFPPVLTWQEVLMDNVTGNFGTLSTLITTFNLTLTIGGTLTIFAPTDEAFDRLLDTFPAEDVTEDFLQQVLLYHVVSGTIFLPALSFRTELLTLSGEYINITVGENGAIFLNNDILILDQIICTNGVVFPISDILVPPSLRPDIPIGPSPGAQCQTQECCSNRANPNPQTGDGFLEFRERCLEGGLHCLESSGCQLCHSEDVPTNVHNRPICGSGVEFPLPACDSQSCCTQRMVANPQTGYGYLQFNSTCLTGGLFCFEFSGCQTCFNSNTNATNVLNRPVCSDSATSTFPSAIKHLGSHRPNHHSSASLIDFAFAALILMVCFVL